MSTSEPQRRSGGRNRSNSVGGTVFTTNEEDTLQNVSKAVFYASIVAALNALFMAVAEAIIEILLVAGWLPKITFRLDFLFLTATSALLGYHTVCGVRKKEFDVTRDALQVAFLVEIALISGDIHFIRNEYDKEKASFWIRGPFVILTAINVVIVSWLYWHLFIASTGDDSSSSSDTETKKETSEEEKNEENV